LGDEIDVRKNEGIAFRKFQFKQRQEGIPMRPNIFTIFGDDVYLGVTPAQRCRKADIGGNFRPTRCLVSATQK